MNRSYSKVLKETYGGNIETGMILLNDHSTNELMIKDQQMYNMHDELSCNVQSSDESDNGVCVVINESKVNLIHVPRLLNKNPTYMCPSNPYCMYSNGRPKSVKNDSEKTICFCPIL